MQKRELAKKPIPFLKLLALFNFMIIGALFMPTKVYFSLLTSFVSTLPFSPSDLFSAPLPLFLFDEISTVITRMIRAAIPTTVKKITGFWLPSLLVFWGSFVGSVS